MKRLLLLAAFVALNAQAEVKTVQASGMGDTCPQALQNAKRVALDKANGSFLHSVEKTKDGSYVGFIEEYSGGVIKSYKYLRDDCTFVIIEAQVVVRSNVVQFNGADLNKDQIIYIKGIKEERDRKRDAIKLLDNRRDAVYFTTDQITMSVPDDSEYVDVNITGEFAFKDKWKSDWKSLREMFGYFNMPSFAPTGNVLVTGYDADDKKVFERKVYLNFVAGGEWRMWYILQHGADPKVEVRIHEKDAFSLNLRVLLKELERVKSFKVEVI